jgi:tripartite-type tricarboxylate transporter receptor subunit TctC
LFGKKITIIKGDKTFQAYNGNNEVGIHGGSIVARPYVLPPGTPKDRVEILRKAFEETFKDKECIAEGEKAQLPFIPVTAEELEKVVAGLFKLDPALIAKLKVITSK